MDAERLDALARALSARTSRRLLAGLAGVPLLGGLAALGDLDMAGAKKKRKKKCKTPKAKLCAGKCGKVKCKKQKINCGGCSNPTPICRQNVCEACSSDADCPGNRVCLDGGCWVCTEEPCQACDVCASGCAHQTVQAAIDAASSGDTIHLCAGTYTRPDSVLDVEVGRIDGKNLTLIGAGAEQTILDGGDVDSPFPVFDVERSTSTLQQLTVTGANGAPGVACGIRSTLTLAQVTVRDNHNEGLGGGMGTYLGTIILDTGTIVRNNHSDDRGGGIQNSIGTIILKNGASVRDNEADVSSGGIHNTGTVTLEPGSLVCGNNHDQCGGDGTYNGACGDSTCPA